MEVNGQFHAPVVLSLGKIATGTHSIGGGVNPTAGLDGVVKSKISAPAGNRTLVIATLSHDAGVILKQSHRGLSTAEIIRYHGKTPREVVLK
jgi:hypothetical protein